MSEFLQLGINFNGKISYIFLLCNMAVYVLLYSFIGGRKHEFMEQFHNIIYD